MTVNMRYEISESENFTIRIWDLDNPNPDNLPFLLQPDWPDGTPWASYEEAENWAKAAIAQRADKTNGGPGVSPAEPFIAYDPEKDAEIIAARAKAKAAAAGLTEEELRFLKLA